MSEQTILLVSPSPDVAAQVRAAVASLHHRLIRASEAREALRYLTVLPTALVVAEQRLPDRDGVDLLEEVKRAAPLAARVLILEPEAGAEVAADALNRARVSYLLRRPLDDLIEVRDIVNLALAGCEDTQDKSALDTLQRVVQGRAAAPDARIRQVERLCTAGEMAGSLVHRFNNTLSIIIGHLELLLLERQDPKLDDRLRPVFQAASDSVQLARRTQEFIRSGPSKHSQVDLNELVADTLKLTEPVWQSTSRRRSGDVRVHTAFQDVPPLMGNPVELREVLTNLILNAVDAMPDGGRLTLRTSTVEGWVSLEIEDTGVGMSESVRKRIFEPFFTTKGEQGNGLGLSIVRRLVQEHGGDIRIESRPGRGTRFILMLPAHTAQAGLRKHPGKPYRRAPETAAPERVPFN